MLKLPKKGSKITRGAIELNADGTYTIAFEKPFESETAFKKIVDDDVSVCLEDGDSILDSSFETNSITLNIADLRGFRKRMGLLLYSL
jgi:hypothetical protein